MSKSHVTLEQHQCLVCGELYDTGNILMQRGLGYPPRFNQHTMTGHGVCPSHRKEGYVCIVEASADVTGDRVKNEDLGSVSPTGQIAYVRVEAWAQVFEGAPLPLDGVAFCEPGVIAKLQALIPPDDQQQEDGP
jgi:hypothetical protein